MAAVNYTFRLSPNERKHLDMLALNDGLNNSEYIRKQVFGKNVKLRKKILSADVAELYKIRELCAELGGALVQAAIKTKQFTGQQNDEIENLIPSIKNMVLEMNKIMGKQ